MGIFIDTGFFLGLVHPKDENHERSKDLLFEMSEGKFGLIYSSPYVIAETATIIMIRTSNNISLLEDFYQMLYGEHQFIRILPWTLNIEEQTWTIFKSHNKFPQSKKNLLSFVDSSSLVFCRQFNIDKILAFDRDFEAYLTRIY